MKTILIVIGILVLIGVGGYLLSRHVWTVFWKFLEDLYNSLH